MNSEKNYLEELYCFELLSPLAESDALSVSELGWSLSDSDNELLLCSCRCWCHNLRHGSTHIAGWAAGHNAQMYLDSFHGWLFLRLQYLYSQVGLFFRQDQCVELWHLHSFSFLQFSNQLCDDTYFETCYI